MEGIGQLGIGPASVEESEKGALELGSSRNKDEKMVQLDSVNYKAAEDPEPMHVCKPLGQPPVEPVREKATKWQKVVTYIQESQAEMS